MLVNFLAILRKKGWKFYVVSYKPILSVPLLVLNNVDAVGRPKAKEEMGMPTGTVNVSILHSERKKGQWPTQFRRSFFLLLGLHFQEKKNV